MGTIKTTNIETITGSGTLTLGQSGETISVPSGATLDLSNATQTGVGEDNTPYWRANRSSGQSFSSSTNTTVLFNNTLFDSASGFNTTTGKYTIPSGQGGKYFLLTSLRFNNASMDHEVAVYFIVDSTEKSFSNKTVGGNYSTVIHSDILQLNAGAEVFVRVYTGLASPELDGGASAITTSFEGFKIAT